MNNYTELRGHNARIANPLLVRHKRNRFVTSLSQFLHLLVGGCNLGVCRFLSYSVCRHPFPVSPLAGWEPAGSPLTLLAPDTVRVLLECLVQLSRRPEGEEL